MTTSTAPQQNNFDSFSLPPSLFKALKSEQYKKPTLVQSQAIPSALLNRDLLVQASSEAGKKAAFCISVLAKLEKSPQKFALILTSKNEYAIQIENILKNLSKFCPKINTAVLLNGGSLNAQASALQARPRIVVATPARLVEHLKRGNVSLFRTEVLVLDDAAQMMSAVTTVHLTEILRFLPKTRQTLFVSGSELSPEGLRFATKCLKDPVRIASIVETVKKKAAKPTAAKTIAKAPKASLTSWQEIPRLLTVVHKTMSPRATAKLN